MIDPEVFDTHLLTPEQTAKVERALYRVCTFDWGKLKTGIQELGRGPIQFFILGSGFGVFSLSAWEVGGGPGIGFVNDVFGLNWKLDYLGRVGAWITKRKRFARRYRRYRNLGFSEYTDAVICHEAFHAVGSFFIERFQDKVEAIDKLAGPDPYEQHEWIPVALKAYTNLLIPEVSLGDAARFRKIVEA